MQPSCTGGTPGRLAGKPGMGGGHHWGDGLRVRNFVSGCPEPSRQKEGAEARNACVPTTVWVGAPLWGDVKPSSWSSDFRSAAEG